MHKINIASTVIRITDPCYDRDTSLSCVGIVQNILPGEWHCELFADRGVCSHIKISHLWSRSIGVTGPEGTASVDSGQCGFIDDSVMPEKVGDYNEEDSFYRKVCNETLENGFIIDKNFFFTGTAYGDGTYRWTSELNANGEVVSITLYYIEEDEDDEEVEDWNEEDEEYEDEEGTEA